MPLGNFLLGPHGFDPKIEDLAIKPGFIGSNLTFAEFLSQKLLRGFVRPQRYNVYLPVFVVAHVYGCIRSGQYRQEKSLPTQEYCIQTIGKPLLNGQKVPLQKNKKMSQGKVTKAIPVRLFEEDRDKLKKYEQHGVNMSEIIRRCVRKSLPDVMREIREELQRLESNS